MKYKVFVTRQIPDEGVKMLKKASNVKLEIYEKDKKIPRGELKRRVKGVDIILSILTEQIDAEIMDAAGPQLKMIANYAVGFDNIDLEAARLRGITVTNAPNTEIIESVAEHTIALMFALAKRIPEADRFTRKGNYKAWGPELLMGIDLWGKTVGIIGTGKIGSGVVRRLRDGFNMRVLYHDVHKNPELETDTGAQYRSLAQLLKQSDFVSLHVPLLPSTRHLIGTKQLALMKKTAYIINTSRGPVIEEAALVKALQQGDIAGAGLDVYECEPALSCNAKSHYQLKDLENVVLTPHSASATIGTRQALSRVAAQNILAFVRGKTPPNNVK